MVETDVDNTGATASEQPRSALDAIRKARSAGGAGSTAWDKRSASGASLASGTGPGRGTHVRPTSPMQIPARKDATGAQSGAPETRTSRSRLMEDSIRRMALEGVDFDSDVSRMVGWLCARGTALWNVLLAHLGGL